MLKTAINIQQELEKQQRFETLLAEISADFVSLPVDRFDDLIVDAQRRICQHFGLDRSILWQVFEKDAEKMVLSHIYQPVETKLPDSPFDARNGFPWILNRVMQGDIVTISGLEKLPQEADSDRESLKAIGARSAIVMPLMIADAFVGALSFARLQDEAPWSESIVKRLQLIAQLFSNALSRKQSEEILEERLQFEILLTEISSRFVNLPADRIDSEIEDAQGLICECLGLDLSALWQWSDETPRIFILTHLHAPPEGPFRPERLDAQEAFPWNLQTLIAGELKAFNTEDLPPEALRDLESYRFYGIKSTVSIPLSVGGGPLIGALSFNSLRSERFWPQPILKNLQTVAQIFANALARKCADLEMRNMKEQLCMRLAEIEALKQQIEKENVYLREEIKLKNIHGEIIGRSPAMMQILAQVEQVARTDATVLIEGETGTGKELLARAVHQLSDRKNRPLVTVNCASLPPTLIESELFGREKGAYTGAMTRMTGRFEVADGATLFLDEIGELPLDVQAKLLRVLEQGCFERLGSTRTLKVDVRIIAATNLDLSQEAAAGRFRKDLYYRLNVFPIRLPPLRERMEDIPPMVWSFVREYEKKIGKRVDHISRKSMDALQRYPWPGNVRELRNVIERAMIVCSGRTLETSLPPLGASIEKPIDLSLEEIERRHILDVLKQTGGRLSGQGGAAGILKMKRSTLQSRIKKLGIQRLSRSC